MYVTYPRHSGSESCRGRDYARGFRERYVINAFTAVVEDLMPIQYWFGLGLHQIVWQATAGLAGMKDGDDLLSSYDDLVKAKGILDLILELPSFEAELGDVRCCVAACIPPSEHYVDYQ